MGQAKPFRATVLVVEDDEDERFLASTLFEESELNVIECESAEAALAVMDEKPEGVAMIFTDIRLAGKMDGVELTRIMRRRYPHVPVLVTSGDGERARDLPQDSKFVPKPWRALDLLMTAEKVRLAAQRNEWRGDIL